jgi:hypothetical protein
MLERSGKNLAWRTAAPLWAQRRAEEKADAEFQLVADPDDPFSPSS